MSDEGRKTNKHYTGTVPKVRQRNNITSFINERESTESASNNLAGYWQQIPDPSGFIRNPRRNQRNNYFTMNSTIEENTLPQTNGCSTMSLNGSPSTSLTTSRRNSSGSTLKCDNVSKYPDKKQIEDKLHQIREYLKLMTAMKNTDEQIGDTDNTEVLLNDLRDSEKKLTDILVGYQNENQENGHIQASENEIDEPSMECNHQANKKNKINLEHARPEAETLREQQLTLLQLQQKAENKLRDARQVTANMMSLQGNQLNGVSSSSNDYADFDNAIRELEEKTKSLGPTAMTNKKMQENILARVESLHNQIVSMHDANDEREKLIVALDSRDTELRQQQAELQSKLVELQNKKSQVDQLVTQLQTFANEEEDDDIGVKVRNIVAMKDQLNKLQDMLEVVKSAETTMTNSNASVEAQAAALDTCLNIESILEKDTQKPKLRPTVSNDSNVLRYDNDTSSEGRSKQTNKNKKDQRLAMNQKSALQSELEIKKRELEELMGKHKASTSNLNHDVGLDIKSEVSYNSNIVNEAWPPLSSSQQHHTDSDRFSSDECQEDDYPDIEEPAEDVGNAVMSPSLMNCYPSKYRSGSTGATERRNANQKRGERNVRSGSVPVPHIASTGAVRHHQRSRCTSNSDRENKTQVQKQLQLIKSMCESMLDVDGPQNGEAPSSANVRQLRNDLTPSPLYSAPPNVPVPVDSVPWFPNNGGGDGNGYQGWLATNAFQTQSFLLSTLNQCCQMLWLQQRELAALRTAVNVLQERLDSSDQYGLGGMAHPEHHHQMPPSFPSEHQRSTANLYRYGGAGGLKANQMQQQQQQQQVSAAFSMPNLNHFASSTSHHPQGAPSNPYVPQVPTGLNNNHPNNTTMLPPPPNHMWLNNQIPPGNRANNYWDNFRSYSRQNLLTTKNCEVSQNSPSIVDRSNANERTNPFSLTSFSKCNSEQDSTSTSHENTPQRKRHGNIPAVDVMNMNQQHSQNLTGPGPMNKRIDEHLDLPTEEITNDNHHLLLNLGGGSANDNSSNHSNLSDAEHIFKECIPDQCRRRNEWNEDGDAEHGYKSKLFEELRENVYKEVASLISANETRPHFLIQLFRDLQMIGSDSLRLKILQSIQMIITHSSIPSAAQNPNRLSTESQTTSGLEATQTDDSFSFQTTVWAKPVKNSSNVCNDNEPTEYLQFLKEALPFLSDHDDDIFMTPLLTQFKQILLNSTSLRDAVKDVVFLKHFSNVLDTVFEQYLGEKVCHIKVDLLQTLNELLSGELSFIQFIHDNNPESNGNHMDGEDRTSTYSLPTNDHQKNAARPQITDNIQNGDLCEADQTRILNEDIDMEEEEEGAVGGIIERKIDSCPVQTAGDIDLNVDFPSNVEGLDQVPTRLPTRSKSRSSTPNKDRSGCRSDPDTTF